MKRSGRQPDGAEVLLVQDIEMELVRKDIRTLRIRVYASDGRIRLSAPRHMGEAALRRFVEDRLPWIRQKRALFASRPAAGGRDLATGDTAHYEGRPYRLIVAEGRGRQSVECGADGSLTLAVRPRSTPESRERLLYAWYRARLVEKLPALAGKWERAIGVSASSWGIKRMKTRWGSCNTGAKRIWLNLELATKPNECLEYVVVHELVHLLERSHDARFKSLMDGFLPEWRAIRKTLNYGSPMHEE
jgi:predicted metal-dependent hydrolase